MQTPKQVKRNFVGHKGIRGRDHGDPYRTRDEDESFPVDVGYASPEEEEAAKGEGVG